MLKFRLRPNRYVMAKNYVQVVSTNKEYRDIALDWLTSNVEGQPVKARATLTLPNGAEVDATAFYGQNTPILKGKLEVSEPKFLGVIFGTDAVVSEYATNMDAVFEVLHVSNDKSYLALKPIQPAFSCIWFIPKPGIERSVQVTNVSRTKAQ